MANIQAVNEEKAIGVQVARLMIIPEGEIMFQMEVKNQIMTVSNDATSIHIAEDDGINICEAMKAGRNVCGVAGIVGKMGDRVDTVVLKERIVTLVNRRQECIEMERTLLEIGLDVLVRRKGSLMMRTPV